MTRWIGKATLPVPIEIVVAVAGAFGAITPLWYSISTAKIAEKAKDLQAGDRNRTEYVIREVPKLEPKLSSAIAAVRKLEKSPNPRLTGELKTNLEDLVDLVEEIDTIQDAQTGMISALRDTRDRGLILLVVLAFFSALWIVGSTVLEGSSLGVVVAALLGLAALYLLPLGGFWVYSRYRKYRRISDLLKKKNLQVLAA